MFSILELDVNSMVEPSVSHPQCGGSELGREAVDANKVCYVHSPVVRSITKTWGRVFFCVAMGTTAFPFVFRTVVC